jgi:hypothetical protein
MHSMRTLMSTLSLTLAVGCGGSTSASPQDSGSPPDGANQKDTGSQGDSGSPVDSGEPSDAWGVTPDGGPWSAVCPETQPTSGSSCTQQGLNCEYGNAWWDVACDTVMVCNGVTWGQGSPTAPPCFPEPGPNSSSCPTNPASIPDTCTNVGLACYYGFGTSYTCEVAPGDAGTIWRGWPESGCPNARPRLGAACTNPIVCNYSCDYAEWCLSGVWQPTNSQCQ